MSTIWYKCFGLEVAVTFSPPKYTEMDDQVYALTKGFTKIHVENIPIILDKDQSEKRERNVSAQYLVGDLIR